LKVSKYSKSQFLSFKQCFHNSLFGFIGCLTDYYIAIGINYLGKCDFAQKCFFWCSGENMNFSELPAPLSNTCRPLFDQIQSVFTGEFEKTIVKSNGESKFLFADKELLEKV